MFFKKNIFGSNAGKTFEEYRKIRNALLHYRHTYKEVEMSGWRVIGLTDTTNVHNLDISYLFNAKKVVRDFLSEVLKNAGCKENQLSGNIQRWTGHVELKQT